MALIILKVVSLDAITAVGGGVAALPSRSAPLVR